MLFWFQSRSFEADEARVLTHDGSSSANQCTLVGGRCAY